MFWVLGRPQEAIKQRSSSEHRVWRSVVCSRRGVRMCVTHGLSRRASRLFGGPGGTKQLREWAGSWGEVEAGTVDSGRGRRA